MSSGSPEERRRIKFEDFGEKSSQFIEMPLRLVVLSELGGRDLRGRSAPGYGKRTRIDKDNFDEVISQFAPRVALTVPNRLGDGPKELQVEIQVREIKAFRPEAIAEQVPALGELLRVRQLLADLRGRKLSPQEFEQRLERWRISAPLRERIRSALASTSVPPPPQAARPTKTVSRAEPRKDTLESIFEMVEVPEAASGQPISTPRAVSSAIEDFISLLAGMQRAGEPMDIRAADALIEELDLLLSVQINEILHHPEFRRLESAWRGLKFLVDHIDFRANIQLEVMGVAKEALRDAFHESIFLPEYEGLTDVPVSAIIADYEFDNSPQDIELLASVAQMAEQIQAPLISAISPEFLGLSSARELPELPHLGELFSRPEYIKWNSFRLGEPSRWTALTFNRFLLRTPYGPENRVKTFNFNEAMIDDAHYLWGNPVWALGSLLAASFARVGWCTEITGARSGGVLENLPVREYATRGGEKATIPLETFISDQRQQEFAAAGIIALTCSANSDAAIVLWAPTAHLPEPYADPSETTKSVIRATLPYQFLAGRIAQYVGSIVSRIVPGNTREDIERDFAQALRAFMARTGTTLAADAVRAKVSDSQDDPNYYEIILYVHPGREIMGGRADVILKLQARK